MTADDRATATAATAPRSLQGVASSADEREVTTLTFDDVTLIRSSLHDALIRCEDLGSLFYGELFSRAPGVRAVFPADMGDQRAKLVATLGTVVRHLEDLDVLDDHILHLARVHHRVGATPEQYELVGATLIDVLAGVVPDFGEEHRAAWSRAYAALAAAIQNAA